jgi:hypothetical protein
VVTLEIHSAGYLEIGKFSPAELEDLLNFGKVSRTRAAQV